MHVTGVSLASHVPLPHRLAGGQSCEQLPVVSVVSQTPLPQTGPVAQSCGQLEEVSAPLHLPSPQTVEPEHAVCAHCSSESDVLLPDCWQVLAHVMASAVQLLKHAMTAWQAASIWHDAH